MLPSVVDLKSSSHFLTDGLQSWLSAQNNSIVFYTFHEWRYNNWLFYRESNRSDLFFLHFKTSPQEYTTQPAARFIFQWSDFKQPQEMLKSCSKVPLSTQKSHFFFLFALQEILLLWKCDGLLCWFNSGVIFEALHTVWFLWWLYKIINTSQNVPTQPKTLE